MILFLSQDISITFRRMDESKRPIGYAPEPDLQGIEPLSYGIEKSSNLNGPTSDGYMKSQPRREVNEERRERTKRKSCPFRTSILQSMRTTACKKTGARLSLWS